MHVHILGTSEGSESIGPSCYLIENCGKLILVDGGYEIRNNKNPQLRGPDIDGISEGSLDAILLTHIHFDHTGAIPLLLSKMKKGAKIWATPQTRELLELTWNDVLLNARAKDSLPFGYFDVKHALMRVSLIEKPGLFDIGGMDFYAHPAGHVRGATSFLFRTDDDRTAMITGDTCWHDQPTVLGAQLPPRQWYPNIICGNDLTNVVPHIAQDPAWSWEKEADRLARMVARTMENGGNVAIPGFRINRSQSVVLALKKRGITVWLDGSAREVARSFATTSWSDRDVAIRLEDFNFIEDPDHRQYLLARNEPFVVCAPGGMASGGIITHWLEHILPDPLSAVCFVGYVAPGTTGESIIRQAQNGGGEITLRKRREDIVVPVRAQIEKFRLTSHQRWNDVIDFIKTVGAQTVALTHGTQNAKEFLAGFLAKEGRDIII